MDQGLTIACEGLSDEPVLRKLAELGEFRVDRVIVLGGKAKVDRRLAAYASAARYSKWLVVRDLDNHACAAKLRAHLLPASPAGLSFRLAVREIESWLLADWDEFCSHFSTRVMPPPDPDNLPNAKSFLLERFLQSRRRVVRTRFVRKESGALYPGTEYVTAIKDFVNQCWDPHRAESRSPSLKRAIASLRRLKQVTL